LEELDAIANGDIVLQREALTKLLTKRSEHKEGSASYASLDMAIAQVLNPKEAVALRRERMNLQMLQYLTVQAERTPQNLSSDTWDVVDVRLLSPSKDEIDPESG